VRAVDTNVLVRALLADPAERAEVEVAQAFLTAEKVVFVQEVVLAELPWVMRTAYSQSRTEIARVVAGILDHERYVVERPSLARAALETYKASSADFSDCLLLAGARAKSCDLVTFDKKLAKVAGAVSIVSIIDGRGDDA
jgi:predicted nucleic-acid-binding protein